jgi:hypothetical protein
MNTIKSPQNITSEAKAIAALADRAEASLPIHERMVPRTTGEQIGIPQIRFTNKTDRDDPRADMREVITFQRQLDRLMANVQDFQSRFVTGTSSKELSVQLKTLYDAVDIDLGITDTDWDAAGIKDYINEINTTAKDKLVELKKIRYGHEHRLERSKISKGLIESYRYIAKLRLKQAQLFLEQKDLDQKSASVACQNIMPMLIQSDIACDKLKQELNWSKNRVETGKRTKEIETLDTLGKTIWGIDLAELDMSTSPDGSKTTIRQHTWIRPRAYVTTIIQDLKANDPESAIDRLGDLIGLYQNTQSVHFLTNHKSIETQLKSLRTLILKQTETSLNEAMPEIKEQIQAIQALVIPVDQAHPIYKNFVFDKDPAAALRSRVYILQGNVKDFEKVSKTITYLENLAGNDSPGRRSAHDIPGLLTMAAKATKLSQGEKETLDTDIAEIIQWTKVGNVYPKQFSRDFLEHVPAIINRGFESQNNNPAEAKKQFKKAAAEINKAVNKLRKRLTDLAGISRGTSRKFDSLLIEYKDMHIKSMSYELLRLFNKGDYDTALTEIQKIKKLYFNYLSPEPGYKRVVNDLAQIENCIRKAPSSSYLNDLKNDMEYFCKLMSLDIDQKHRLRLTAFNLDDAPAKAQFIFPKEEIRTENDLLTWLQREHISLKSPKTEEERGFRGKSDKLLEDEEEYLVSKTEITGLSPALKLGRAEIVQE